MDGREILSFTRYKQRVWLQRLVLPPRIASDDRLSVEEFSLICRALFRNDQGHIYVAEPGQIQQMFGVFDKNIDGFIDRDEFKFCWNYWIKTVSDAT